jgi:hypothetical protein
MDVLEKVHRVVWNVCAGLVVQVVSRFIRVRFEEFVNQLVVATDFIESCYS